jgi:hypothetical protein
MPQASTIRHAKHRMIECRIDACGMTNPMVDLSVYKTLWLTCHYKVFVFLCVFVPWWFNFLSEKFPDDLFCFFTGPFKIIVYDHLIKAMLERKFVTGFADPCL